MSLAAKDTYSSNQSVSIISNKRSCRSCCSRLDDGFSRSSADLRLARNSSNGDLRNIPSRSQCLCERTPPPLAVTVEPIGPCQNQPGEFAGVDIDCVAIDRSRERRD